MIYKQTVSKEIMPTETFAKIKYVSTLPVGDANKRTIPSSKGRGYAKMSVR
jgi:hypothetical protein